MNEKFPCIMIKLPNFLVGGIELQNLRRFVEKNKRERFGRN